MAVAASVASPLTSRVLPAGLLFCRATGSNLRHLFAAPRHLFLIGVGAGGMRVKSSESERLLRQWWNEPGDYLWVVEFFRLRGFMTVLRASTGAGGY